MRKAVSLAIGLALAWSVAAGTASAIVYNAVDVLTCNDSTNLGGSYSVGWDFTINQTITVTSLGQFDPDSTPVTNQVAIYQRGGAQVVQTTVSNTLPEVMSGNFNARYASIPSTVLGPGNYVIMSTQQGNRFIAPFGNPTATFGTGITWNKGVAFSGAAGPLPTTAPTGTWQIENTTAYRYLGPTFQYQISGNPPPPPPPPPPGKTIHYLPLGDSITQFGTYFSSLNTLFSNNGYTADMIANEGHSGFNVDGTIVGATRQGLRENINAFLNHPNVNNPDTYILMMIGTNDVDTNCALGSTAVQTRMKGLIDAIKGIAPLSHLVVAQIVPNLGSIQKDTNVKQFNLDIAAAVAAAQAEGGNVSLVDMYDAFNPSQYVPYTGVWNPNMGDTLHPNATGGAVMAQVWFDGIQATTVPEPGTIALLMTGGLALLAFVWRRRK